MVSSRQAPLLVWWASASALSNDRIVDVIPLSEQIPSGKQALTISTGNVQGVNGFIEAGDRLNMIISLSIPLDLIPLDLEGVPLPDDVVLPGEPDETATTGEEAPAEVFQYTRYVLQGIPVLGAPGARLGRQGAQHCATGH